ncbi:putative FMN-dependent luciferase-like monooxygenase [Enterovirga rhinocerotis]|uniref:Putative FMN-dependent luciferase-like monooxygenase n=1 Tax=Enterovirga rhinocerotis TaxID=1339210 RepID=A0A4R7C5X0_9HYPH|nr:putative FMN-dependent luciferase-like monooxygenase [Enterovirga rhinocerotis]TDR93483.1 putative FMN-dependent luciferase-like monooxygenase [Enterovirga rhinocerotis]
MSGSPRLGFFTRLLDEGGPGERYRLATEQIRQAERFGYDSAWIAQHHFDGDEGGLPSPLVFLAHVAAATRGIRLGTGILTLALEQPLRAAEDAAVLDLLCGGRLDLGLGTGGSAASFAAFGYESGERGEIYGRHLETFRRALRGEALEGGAVLYPPAGTLAGRLWQATFSVAGGERAGRAGDGLMLSRTQPRPPGQPGLSLAEIQDPIIDAYLAALPHGAEPRILASRSAFVTDRREEALRLAEPGLRLWAARARARGEGELGTDAATIAAASDLHIGTPDEVAESLARDATLRRASEVTIQIHSADPPHEAVMRSIELFATRVAPQLGLGRRSPTQPVAAA